MAVIIISIALMLFCGFAMTRLTKRLRLPNVTAYILTGILLGPYCLKMIQVSVISGVYRFQHRRIFPAGNPA